MKNTKFLKNQNGNLLIEAMLGIALAGAGFLVFYEIEHKVSDRKQFSKVTSNMYQQYNVFLTALEKYGQSNNSTQVVSCQTLKNGYLAQNFNCTDYLGDTLEGILVKNKTQTPTAYVVGVPSASSQNMLNSYNVSSVQVLNQALAQSQPENTTHEFFVVNLNNYIGYPVTNISQSMSFSTIASYLPQQGLKLGNNSYVISLVDASTLNPSAAPPSCYSSSSVLNPPGTWQHSFTNITGPSNSSTTSVTQCSYTEWQPYQYCSYVNGQTSTSNNGSPFSTSSCSVVLTILNAYTTSTVFTGTSACPPGYTGSVSNYDSVTSYTSCTNGACNYWSTSSQAPSVSNCTPSSSSAGSGGGSGGNTPPQPPQLQPPGGGGGNNGGGSGTAQPGGSVCPSGYVWNPNYQECVNATQYTMACYPPYYNAVASGPDGLVLCAYAGACPSGAIYTGITSWTTYQGVPVGYGYCEYVVNPQYLCPSGYSFDPSTSLCLSGQYEQCPYYGLLQSLQLSGWSCTLNNWCAINCTNGSMVISQGTYFPSNGTADTNPSDSTYGWYQISTQPKLVASSTTLVNAEPCPYDSRSVQGFHIVPQEPTCYDWGYFTSVATPLSCPAGESLNVYTGTCQ